MLFHSNQAEKRQQNNYVDSWLGRKQTAAGSPASSPDVVRLWKWWGLFTIIVYLAQVSGFTDSFFCKDNWNVHICSNIVCNSHITGPLAWESTAEQLFKVHLFPPTNDGLWISSWVNAKSLEAAEAYFWPLPPSQKSESSNFLARKCVFSLTQSSESLQFVLAVGGVRPADLENLVLAIAAGLAQQSPVGTWNHSPMSLIKR